MIDNRTIADLLDGASNDALRPIGIKVTPPMILSHQGSVFSFKMIMPSIRIDRYAVVSRNHDPRAFMGMLTDKLFVQIAGAYKYMVEKWACVLYTTTTTAETRTMWMGS